MGRRYEHPITHTKLRQVLDAQIQSGRYRYYTQIAQASGVRVSRLSEYSLGRKPIPIHHILRLCEVLGCVPADLLGPADAEGRDSRRVG